MGSTFFATEEHLLYNRLRDKTDSQWVHLYGAEPCEYVTDRRTDRVTCSGSICMVLSRVNM